MSLISHQHSRVGLHCPSAHRALALAVADLRGSIHPDELKVMAVTLALARLNGRQPGSFIRDRDGRR